MVRISQLSAMKRMRRLWYLRLPAVRRSYDAALGALNARFGNELRGVDVGQELSFFTRQHDSVLFRLCLSLPCAPDGFLIKVPLSSARAQSWDAEGEAEQLARLSAVGPSGESFQYLVATCVEVDPPFLVMPYFRSDSLRNLLAQVARSGPDGKCMDRVVSACAAAGYWLGECYRTSPVEDVIDWNHSLDFVHERLEVLWSSGPSRLRDLCGRLRERASDYLQGQALGVVGPHVPRPVSVPRVVHGDFVSDNVLVDESGRICVIDPEVRKTAAYADFVRFRESLVLSLKIRGNCDSVVSSRIARAFLSSFREAYPSYRHAGQQYFIHAVAKLVWHYCGGQNMRSASFSPRQWLVRRDVVGQVRYLECWLDRLTNDSRACWEVLESDL